MEVEECIKCGITSDKVRLLDAVGNDGIVKICRACSENEDFVILKKPTTFQLKEAEKPYTVYERLSRSAGISRKKNKMTEKEKQENSNDIPTTLSELMDKRIKINTEKHEHPVFELVDNFHWVVMMARKRRHLTHKEVADAIQESEAVIKMVERGSLPEDDFRILNKLENFFNIKLIKSGYGLRKQEQEQEPLIKKPPARILDFKPEAVQNLTIADLRELKKQQEMIEGTEVSEKNKTSEIEAEKKKEEKLKKKFNERELSEEDISNFIWKGK